MCLAEQSLLAAVFYSFTLFFSFAWSVFITKFKFFVPLLSDFSTVAFIVIYV